MNKFKYCGLYLILLVILIAFIILLLVQNISYKKNTQNAFLLIDSIVNKQYEQEKSIDVYNVRSDVDSVYLKGNQIINSKNFDVLYDCFLKEFGRELYLGPENKDKDYLALKIKLLQLQYIDNEIKYEYESYFQVDAIGIRSVDPTINYGANKPIKLFLEYSHLKKIPIVEIEGDTLKYEAPFYIFNFKKEEQEKQEINANVTIERWNNTLVLTCPLRVNIK